MLIPSPFVHTTLQRSFKCMGHSYKPGTGTQKCCIAKGLLS
jgi:hypothetical protein